MPKSKKTIPIYEYKEKVGGQTRYYIRPSINGIQITKRLDDNGNMWLGNAGYSKALEEITKLQNTAKSSCNTELTFGFLKEKYLEDISKTKKRSTYDSYCDVIKNQISEYFSEDLKVNNMTNQLIIDWHEIIETKPLAIRYKQKIHQVLASILDKGKLYNYGENVARNVGNFKENNSIVVSDDEKLKYITLEEFNIFISYIHDDLWKTFFTFLYYTGCRRGEVLALNWHDIDFNNSVISINKTINTKIKGSYEITNTKNHENRKIKINKLLKNQLWEYKKRIMRLHDFNEEWFVFGNDKHLCLTTIDRVKDRHFDLSGVKRITVHEFRHSHVSLLINEYIKQGNTDTAKFFVMMSQRMGHTIEVMQKTYMHLFPTAQDEIVNLLDDLTFAS